MEEKFYYENLLTQVKSICNILFFAATESSNPHVHQTFQTQLNRCLEWQNAIYKQMETKGFYQVENIDSSTIEKEQQNIQPLNINCGDCCSNQDYAK